MSDDEKMIINVVSPPAEREPGAVRPLGRWPGEDIVTAAGMADLRSCGCRPWNRSNDPEDDGTFPPGKVLMLFPVQWYKTIPDGFPIVDIMGNWEKFVAGETDDDARFGCLSYGVLVDDEVKP